MKERVNVLTEKNQLLDIVISTMKAEKSPSNGDEALYRVFKSSEWHASGIKSIRDLDFTAAAEQLFRYLKPKVWKRWMKSGLKNQLELYKTFVLVDLDAMETRQSLESNI